MYEGYISLRTHPDQPGLVRLVPSESNPRSEPAHAGTGQLRYVLKFVDLDTAMQHAHNAMRRQLVDINQHLYKTPLAAAMGDLDAIEIRHELIWQDPELTEEELDQMEDELVHRHQGQRRRDRVIQVIKWVAIALLVFNLLAPGISELINGSPEETGNPIH